MVTHLRFRPRSNRKPVLEIDREILNQFAQSVVPEIQSVVGSFAPSIGYRIGESALTIDGHPHIGVLNYGRGPTRNGVGRSDPSLNEQIMAWIQRHNITPQERNGKTITRETLGYLITKSIHENGTRLYQEIKRGGKPRDVFGNIITESRIENLLSLLSTSYEQRLTSDLLTTLKRVQ